jgi:lysylphosphatidylglycerol synthetase-like protein (DUF2156 family)
MGWPLAVSAALMEGRVARLLSALAALALGHALAMGLVLLPFALISALLDWRKEIEIGAALLVIGAGFALLLNRSHPRALARIPPSRVVLWSFAVAMAHGAGLMLVPVYLGLCSAEDLSAMGLGRDAARIGENAVLALAVASLHTGAMAAAGGTMAWTAYRILGLKLVAQSWFNLDVVWALSLLLVGLVSLVLALA